MMMMMIGMQHHVIISRENIKPVIPTPCHLQTYNLSLIDQCTQHSYVPIVLMYPNNSKSSLLSGKEKAQVMKKSLSQSLTDYYPFAGRLHTPKAPSYVDCNDEGVLFIEAINARRLEVFLRTNEVDESVDELFENGLVCGKSPGNTNLVGVQVNHLACGGIAVGVFISHIIGDGCTLGSFLHHWSLVARYGSPDHEEVLPLKPHFIQSPKTISSNLMPEFAPGIINQGYDNRVVRKFVFPNTKLSDLKNNVIGLGVCNPTRVEVLISLLYKTAIAAATTISGCFTPSHLFMPVNIRNKFVQKLSQSTVGNFSTVIMVPTRDQSETSLNVTVAGIKKEKARVDQGFESVQHVVYDLMLMVSKLSGNQEKIRSYGCSSLCGFPFNKVDFGWGKPMGSTLAIRSLGVNGLSQGYSRWRWYRGLREFGKRRNGNISERQGDAFILPISPSLRITFFICINKRMHMHYAPFV